MYNTLTLVNPMACNASSAGLRLGQWPHGQHPQYRTIDFARGKDSTRLRNCCTPLSLEAGPKYSDPGICACANKTCDPTWIMSGFSLPAVRRIFTRPSGSISCAVGIALAWPDPTEASGTATTTARINIVATILIASFIGPFTLNLATGKNTL